MKATEDVCSWHFPTMHLKWFFRNLEW